MKKIRIKKPKAWICKDFYSYERRLIGAKFNDCERFLVRIMKTSQPEYWSRLNDSFKSELETYINSVRAKGMLE